MSRTAARWMVGMGLVAVALVAGRGVAGSEGAGEPVPVPPLVRGEIAGDGTVVAADAPTVAGRTEEGGYLVVVEGTTRLSVTSWRTVSGVEVRPIGGGVSLVTFLDDAGARLETAFTFVARP